MRLAAVTFVLVSICGQLSSGVARGQVGEPPPIEWERKFGGLEKATGFSVCETQDGGVALAGWTWEGAPLPEPQPIPPTDGYLLVTDASGDLQWEKIIGGAGHDVFRRLEETRDGGFILTGWTESDSGDPDLWLVKANADGAIDLERRFGGSENDFGSTLLETSGGDYAVLGWTRSFGNGGGSAYFIRVTPSGNTVFEKAYVRDACERGVGLAEREDGFLLAVSSGDCGPLGAVRIIETDRLGEALDERTVVAMPEFFGGPYDMTATAEGDLAISGMVLSVEDFQFHAWVMRADTLGNPAWRVDFGSGDPLKVAFAASIRSTKDGGFITSGRPWLAKLDGAGGIVWQLGLPEADLFSARETRDGGFILAGEVGERQNPPMADCLPVVAAGCIFGEAYLAKVAGPAPPASRFRRGDSNADGKLDTADSIFTLNHLFLGGVAPVCSDAADSDDSGVLDLTDGIHAINYLFLSGPAPPTPGPDSCGPDGTEDLLGECAYETAARC